MNSKQTSTYPWRLSPALRLFSSVFVILHNSNSLLINIVAVFRQYKVLAKPACDHAIDLSYIFRTASFCMMDAFEIFYLVCDIDW